MTQQHNPDGTCEGCVPVVFHQNTGRRLTEKELPELAFVVAEYHELPLETKHAWHRVTCENSRDPADFKLVRPFIQRVGKLLRGAKVS